jgi:hypothetical protein
VVIFVHLCEMFIYVWPSISLFRLFHVLRWSRKGLGLISAYYFQFCAMGSIAPISPSKWDRWREDWVIVWADIHNCLVLLTESLTAKSNDWEETLKLHRVYMPMIEWIKHLTRHDLTTMMVLHDFLLRHVMPARLGCTLEKATPCGWSMIVTQIWL